MKKTLSTLIAQHPTLRDLLIDAADMCQPAGRNASGALLFSETLILAAAKSLAGADPFSRAGKGGTAGVLYR
jgi:hypothetical protein